MNRISSFIPTRDLTIIAYNKDGVSFKEDNKHGYGYYFMNIDCFGLFLSYSISANIYDIDYLGRLQIDGVDEL